MLIVDGFVSTTTVLCSVVEVRGAELAKKAIEILHRHEIKGRFLIVREVSIITSAVD